MQGLSYSRLLQAPHSLLPPQPGDCCYGGQLPDGTAQRPAEGEAGGTKWGRSGGPIRDTRRGAQRLEGREEGAPGMGRHEALAGRRPLLPRRLRRTMRSCWMTPWRSSAEQVLALPSFHSQTQNSRLRFVLLLFLCHFNHFLNF